MYVNTYRAWARDLDVGTYHISQFKHILLPKYLQQWGWVTSSHNISFDPSPIFYIYTITYKHGYIYQSVAKAQAESKIATDIHEVRMLITVQTKGFLAIRGGGVGWGSI